jgi:tryptophan-rich sensory protein
MTTHILPLRRTEPSPSIAPRLLLVLVALAISVAPGLVGSVFGPDAWYAALDKSSLTPPGFVFPIVWTALYLMMGVALWLFWESDAPGVTKRVGTALFAVQLVLNGLWPYLFFGLHRPDLALIDIVVLWTAIAASILAFVSYRRAAALLLAPYLAWVTFATYLNFEIWRRL